jgi:1,4-alpha-glucan branching enzyme
MVHFLQQEKIFDQPARKLYENINNQILLYERNKHYFVLNLHPTRSYTDFEFDLPPGEYKIILNSDNPQFGGFNRINESMSYNSYQRIGKHRVKLYLPARTIFVLFFVFLPPQKSS